MKKLSAPLICGLAVMLLTVVLYFTLLTNIVFAAIHFIALAAILLAEGITTAYACTAKGSPRKVAAAIVSGLLIPYAAILSVVYIVNFPAGYGAYIGWFCGGLLIANILAFILVRFDERGNEEHNRLQEAKSNMLGLRKLVMGILADPAAQPYAGKLRALEEKLHFSNDAVIAAEDETIRSLLLQLQENIADPESACEQILEKIEKTIEVRSVMTARNV